MMPEISNPLTGGAIVSVNTDPPSYHRINDGLKRSWPDWVMSNSELREFARCPRKWLAGRDERDTDATIWGTGIDCLLLTPDRFDDVFAIRPETYPDTKTGEPKPWSGNSTWCKEWLAKNSDRIPIRSRPKSDDTGARAPSKQEFDTAIARLRSDLVVHGILQQSQKQVFVTAKYCDPDTRLTVNLKTLVDIAPAKESDGFVKNALIDLKTDRDASPRAWQRTVFQRGYHIQAALYLDAWNAATGEERTDFFHIVQENEPPYEVGKRILSQEFLMLGRASYLEYLRFYCQCLKRNYWPGYDEMGDCLGGWLLVQPEAWMVQNFDFPQFNEPEEKEEKQESECP